MKAHTVTEARSRPLDVPTWTETALGAGVCTGNDTSADPTVARRVRSFHPHGVTAVGQGIDVLARSLGNRHPVDRHHRGPVPHGVGEGGVASAVGPEAHEE